MCFSSISFILFHSLVVSHVEDNPTYGVERIYNIKGFPLEGRYRYLFIKITRHRHNSIDTLIDDLIEDATSTRQEDYIQSKVEDEIRFIKDNILNIKAIYFTSIFNFHENISDVMLLKINNYIKTGILIDE